MDKEPEAAFSCTSPSETVIEQLAISCDKAKSYPHSLIHPNIYEYHLSAYHQRLNEREDSLFQNDVEAALDFWEFDAQGNGASAKLELNSGVPDNGF